MKILPEVWFPVVTLVVGAAIALLAEALRDSRTKGREITARREARSDTLRQRRADFQRATLLDLQTAIADLVRRAAQVNYHYVMASRREAPWKRTMLPEEVDDGFRIAMGKGMLLSVRVSDDEVRNLYEELARAASSVASAPQESASDMALMETAAMHQKLNARIGRLVRSLDDEDD